MKKLTVLSRLFRKIRIFLFLWRNNNRLRAVRAGKIENLPYKNGWFSSHMSDSEIKYEDSYTKIGPLVIGCSPREYLNKMAACDRGRLIKEALAIGRNYRKDKS